jgi:hypothetical protein
MARQISDETRNETTRCPFSFQCLDDENICTCSVVWSLKKNGCFLKTVKPNICPYKVTFSSSYVCQCPTRHELFKRYKI